MSWSLPQQRLGGTHVEERSRHQDEAGRSTPDLAKPANADQEAIPVEDLLEDVSIDGMCGVY
jgi:mycofactocin precursor